MLSVRGLSVRYGRSVAALHDVQVELPEAGVLAVLGATGSGKSTLLRAVCGLLGARRGVITAGQIEFRGRRTDGWDPARVVRSGIAAVPQGGPVFTRMSVAANLRAGGLGARSGAERASARSRVEALFPVLAERAGQPAGLLAADEQRMLAIGRALRAGPALLLLDEPSLGLSAGRVDWLAEAIASIHGQGTAVVLLEQQGGLARRVAEQAIVLEGGRLTRSGPVAEVAPIAAGWPAARSAAGHPVLPRWAG